MRESDRNSVLNRQFRLIEQRGDHDRRNRSLSEGAAPIAAYLAEAACRTDSSCAENAELLGVQHLSAAPARVGGGAEGPGCFGCAERAGIGVGRGAARC